MTQNEALEALAGTWRFEPIGDLVVLREVSLIEAVRTQETTRLPNLPRSSNYVDTQVQHSS